MSLADSVVKLEAVCYKCQASASFSARITDEKETVVIGGADAVLAASIFHFDDHAIADAKDHMIAAGVNVRP